MPPVTPIDQYEAKGRYTIHPTTKCWEWQRSTSKLGFPVVKIENGKIINARRHIYEHHHTQIPDGSILIAKCTNRHCVNPNHMQVTNYNTQYGKPDPTIKAARYYKNPETGCWEWLLQCNTSNGYPLTRREIDGRSKTCSAVRAVYTDEKGDVPAGVILRKQCGNKTCVNPDHHRVVASMKHREE